MEADLVAAEGDSVTFSRNGRTYDYPLANLSEEDRKYIQDWIEEQAKPSVFVSEFSEQLVRLEGQSFRDFPEEKLKEKRIVAFYYSAGWCGPCRAFTPELIRSYKSLQANYPHFEIIFISSDQDPKAMADYMKGEKMPFPAVKFDQKNKLPLVRKHSQRGIPNLVLLDESGEAISTSFVSGKYVGPRKVLQDIRKYLAEN